MAITDYYDNTATIQRKTSTNNSYGNIVESWSNVATISCLINQVSSNEQFEAGQLEKLATHKLFCEISTDIEIEDRVLFSGEYYRVVSIPKNTVNRDNHYKIFLQYLGLDNEV